MNQKTDCKCIKSHYVIEEEIFKLQQHLFDNRTTLKLKSDENGAQMHEIKHYTNKRKPRFRIDTRKHAEIQITATFLHSTVDPNRSNLVTI